MGAYAYCQNPDCGAPHDRPSAREVVERERRCYACGKDVPVYDDLADILERMEGRIDDLEAEVKALKGETDGPA
ncbi:hypothetical protein CcrKarma_gp266 [Caulobacter virus Karma]|uniref:hypothetical protein n=1 Tax=Caulobacter virus Karma TaxID=1211641 RepID=UPI00028A8412|nr:hypothetical protein CcrKarma_gp266 [Caulobacter virus Karma]AFU87783.1 hypothetical protein CcrKarma_gp266 [Caulobacter virus Karma]